jgi:hypothetical protein
MWGVLANQCTSPPKPKQPSRAMSTSICRRRPMGALSLAPLWRLAKRLSRLRSKALDSKLESVAKLLAALLAVLPADPLVPESASSPATEAARAEPGCGGGGGLGAGEGHIVCPQVLG